MPSVSKENLRDPSYVASLRVVDAFAHVLRLFEDDTMPHEKGSVDPLRDLEDVETELILSDLVVMEKRLERLEKDRKKIKNPELDREFELLESAKPRWKRILRCANWRSTTKKKAHPRLPVPLSKANAVRAEPGRGGCRRLHEKEREYREGALAGRKGAAVTAMCGKMEAELAELPPAEQKDYLASYGLTRIGLSG